LYNLPCSQKQYVWSLPFFQE